MMTLNMNRVAAKLNDILGARFGVSIEYISITDREKEHAITLETVKRNAGAPMIVGHNQLIVPLRVEGALVGATWVGEINGLEPRDLSEILATIDLAIGGLVSAQATQLDLFELPSNVLSFVPRAHAF